MDNSWKQDPRLKAMNKDKLAMLTEFAERIEHSDKNNMMEAFMAINMEARQKGVQFNDRETDLLVNILSSRMPPSEKKKIDLLKMLSKKNGRAALIAPLPLPYGIVLIELFYGISLTVPNPVQSQS